MDRYKLFSDNIVNRRKLFSVSEVEVNSEPSEKVTNPVICLDCGYRTETDSTTTNLVCPKCGGRRFNVLTADYKEPIKRVSLFSSYSEDESNFQREFSETDNDLELKLKQYSGKEISLDEFRSNFSDSEIVELRENNYCDISDSSVKFSDSAFLQSRLFSKISITITKEMDLEPSIVCNPGCDRSSIINGLEESNHMSPKCIMLIRKAHNISNENKEDEWVNDSGILKDLNLEFGGQEKDEPDFKKIIETRYPDAPDNIMDLLRDKGIIRVGSGKICVI